MARKTRGKLGGGNFLGGFDGLPFTKPYGARSSGEKGDEPFQKAKPGSICSFPVVVRPPSPEGKVVLKAEKKRAAKVLSRAVAKRKAAKSKATPRRPSP